MSDPKTISPSRPARRQSDMQLAPLDPQHFQVDERQLNDYLALTAKVGQAFSFYNVKDKPEGTWGQFLMAEPLFLTSAIKITDTSVLYSRALDFQKAIESRHTASMRKLFFQYYFETGLEIALQINRWQLYSERLYFRNTFTTYLEATIQEKAGPAWQAVYNRYYTLVESIPDFQNRMLTKTNALSSLWNFNPFPLVSANPIFGNLNTEPGADGLSEDITPAQQAWMVETALDMQQLFHVQDLIIGAADKYYADLLERQDIPPQTGLMLSFFRTLQEQQGILNQATKKHLNFYYRDILGMEPRPATPDWTWLTFKLKDELPPYTVPKGTAFQAGVLDDGITLKEYTSEQKLVTLPTAVNALRTLTLLPEEDSDERLVDITVGEVAKPAALPVGYWPTFGQPLGDDQQGPLTETITTLGWSVAAPDLLLTSGKRALRIILTLEKPDGTDLPSTSKLQAASLKDLFQIDITTAEGWIPLPFGDYPGDDLGTIVTLDANNKGISFTLCFALDIDYPATAAYNAEVHGPGYDGQWPVIRMQLTEPKASDDESYGQRFYPLFRQLKLTKLVIDSNAQDFQDFVMQNDDGAVDPTKPFLPFGAQPIQGSHWYLGGKELFCKPLQNVVMEITWDELPLSRSYFRYYLSYNLHPLMVQAPGEKEEKQKAPFYVNQVFQAQSEVLEDGTWSNSLNLTSTDASATTGTYTELFTNGIGNVPITVGVNNVRSTEGPLSPDSAESVYDNEVALSADPWSFSVDLSGKNAYNPNLGEVTEYKPGAVQGYMRLTLANPVQGFGKEDYPRVVNEVTNTNTARTMFAAKNNQAATICSFDNLLKSSSKSISSGSVTGIITDMKTAVTSITDLWTTGDNPKMKDLQGLNTSIASKIDTFISTENTRLATIKSDILADITDLEGKINAISISQYTEFVADFETAKGEIKTQIDTLKSNQNAWALDVYNSFPAAVKTAINDLDNPEEGAPPDPTNKQQVLDALEAAYANLMTEVESIYTKLDGLTIPTDTTTNQIDAAKASLATLKTTVTNANFSLDATNLKKEISDLIDSVDTSLQAKISAQTDTLNTKIDDLNKALGPSFQSIICLEPQPTTPVAPKAKKFTLDYTSHNQWSFNGGTLAGVQLYHQGPWTTWKVVDMNNTTWLPNFDDQGYTYIGLSNSVLDELLTLLLVVENPVQTLRSSSTTNLRIEYPSTEGIWKSLALKEDGTSGLLQSGIIQFSLPTDTQADFNQVAYPSTQSTVWLRILPPSTTENGKETVAPLRELKVRLGYLATNATRVMNTRSGMPSLLPETITQTVQVMEELDTITQPLGSLVGRAEQTEAEFWKSTAWRLQNKSRALRLPDYETLVLEEFPQLFQIAASNSHLTTQLPRLVHLTVAPYTLPTSTDKYRPRASARLMLDTLNFLKPLVPPGQTLQVYNPLYAYLTVTAIIKFEDGDQPLGAIEALTQELMLYLSPWIEDNPYREQQPKTWSKGVIYAFLKQQPKVKSVLNFEATMYLEDDPLKTPLDNLVPPSVAYLVVPSLTQNITPLS